MQEEKKHTEMFEENKKQKICIWRQKEKSRPSVMLEPHPPTSRRSDKKSDVFTSSHNPQHSNTQLAAAVRLNDRNFYICIN